MIDRVNVGEEIKVYFNIKGSKWERDGKNYHQPDAWRIEQILQPGTAKMDNDYLEPLDTFFGNATRRGRRSAF